MSMKLDELRVILQERALFADLSAWRISDLHPGAPELTCRFARDGEAYTVKAVKQNEARVWGLIASFDLAVSPRVIYPDLLSRGVLVAEYVPGEAIRSKKLEPAFIGAFAAFQNALNDEGPMRSRGIDVMKDDDGFHRATFSRCMAGGYDNLAACPDFPIVEKFAEIADLLAPHADQIASAFASMPFAWQHYDFREANIVGSPQKLIDWGSSYGYGPFMYDAAPFLINDPVGLNMYAAHSDICRDADRTRIMHWLMVALSVRFAAFLMWRLNPERQDPDEIDTPVKLRALLEYEYPTYAPLITYAQTSLSA